MKRSTAVIFTLLSISALFMFSCGAERRVRHFNETAAAPESQADRVIETLSIGKGDTVADLGSGGGYFTGKLADAVGPKGAVYAVDINKEYLLLLEKTLKEKKIGNVKYVLPGDASRPQVPDRSLDLLFARNVFHEIDDQASFFGNLKKLLKPGGKIAIIDYKPTAGFSLFEKFLPEETILAKMSEAGYVRVKRYDFLSKQWFGIFTPEKE